MFEIKEDVLLKCPNEEEANQQTKVAIELTRQSGGMTSVGCTIIYGDSQGLAINATNICNKDRKSVRYSNAIILYVLIHNIIHYLKVY